MARYIVQVGLQGASALPKDVFENVFHFSTGGSEATTAECATINTLITSFFNDGSLSIAEFLSPAVLLGVTTKFYDEDGGDPRPLLDTLSFSRRGSDGGHGALPEEVALCLSYYSSANLPRHRGRIYMGPWSTEVLATTPGGIEDGNGVIPSTSLLQAMHDAAVRLIAAGGAGPTWCLRSGGGTDASKTGAVTYQPITHGWIDNEWDAQRRRRVEATARTTF